MGVLKMVQTTRFLTGKNSFLNHYNVHLLRHNCQKKNEKNDEGMKKSKKGDYPEEPTTCCMSGCANCVWLEYAEKLKEFYKDGGEEAMKEIEEKVTDPNMKAFLLHELRMKKG